MIKLTREQNLAIKIKNKNILVSAAAGSGKTYVLVNRIIKLIMHDKINLDKILAVSFTDYASGQIKQKISKVLWEKFSSEKNLVMQENLRTQIELLNNANIFTLHAFCVRLIKKYFYLVNIDPDFKILDQNENEILKSNMLDIILENNYAQNKNKFINLADTYNSDGIYNNNLKELILEIYNFSRSVCDANNWLLNCAKKFDLNLDLEQTDWWQSIRFNLKNIFGETKEFICENIKICELDNGPEKYKFALECDKKFICELEDKNSFDEIYNLLLSFKHEKLFAYKKNDLVDLRLKDLVKNNREQIKKIVLSLKEKIFFESKEFMLENIKNSCEVMQELVRVVIEFDNKLNKKKLELNVLSFDDLERLVIKILKDKSVVKNCFEEILIDEYQDINNIQEEILELINSKSRFMVGDVKQSIYGFRNSAPDLFIKKNNLYENHNYTDGVKINLINNFRSTDKIINFVNFIFERLMNKNFGGVDYKQEKLISFNKTNSDECEILILEDTSKNKIALEAKVICDKIKELVKKNKYNYKDIVVLIRSRNDLDVIKQVFYENNILLDLESDLDFFSQPEIILLINFLRVLDNPRQEIYLVSLLRSKIYDISDDELLNIKKIGEKNFYDCVKKYNGLEKFKSDLKNLREKISLVKLSELINKIIYEINLFCFANESNLVKFVNLAERYEKDNYKSLFDFVKHIESLQDKKIILENKNSKSNLVKIMSIHKSKGLEFPVVFVSFLGKEFNFKNLKAKILFDKNLGLGNKFCDLAKRTRVNTFARAAIELEVYKKNLEEELRILYVAMTRAEKKLILTGSCENKNLNKIISRAKSYMDWIMILINRERENIPAKIKFINNISCEFNKAIINSKKNFYPVEIKTVSQNIKQKLEWEYKNNIFIKSVITIRELYEKKHGVINKKNNFAMPDFMCENKRNVEKIIWHKINFNKITHEDINNFLLNLAKKNIITHEEINLNLINKIKKFLNSDIANKMQRAKFIKHKINFILGLENNKSLVRGIIDCCFECDNKIFMLDYKTDNNINKNISRYKFQADIYKIALERYLKLKINFCVIYFINLDHEFYL